MHYSADLLLGAFLALAATCLGAAAVFAFRKLDCRLSVLAMSFCAGVMAYSSAEMILQSVAQAGTFQTLAGVAAGVGAFFVLEKLLPHAHLLLRKRGLEGGKKKAALMAGTVTLHNVPEGFAIASAFAASPSLGWLVAGSIALQDVPEGAVVSVPVACYGVNARRSFGMGVLSGVVEFFAAVVGFVFLNAVSPLIPFALAFSGGAMAHVALFELFSDAWKKDAAGSAAAAAAGIAVAWGLALLLAV